MDVGKAINRVPCKVLEWMMRMKVMLQVFVRAMISQYEGEKTRVRVDSELSGEFEVNVGCIKNMCYHLLCADNFILMSDGF